MNCLLLLPYIHRVKEETAQHLKQKEALGRKLEKYTMFHTFMDKVQEAGEDFHEIRDIITRWDTLNATHTVRYWFPSVM